MMKQTFTLRLIALLFFAALSQTAKSQCFQIESILVDACGASEGLNEMVRFKTGSTSFNANTLIVDWPSNNWEGIVQNATTAAKTAALNADIVAAGGCGQLIEPTGGMIPANSTAILVTSYNIDTALNPFGAITQNIYIIYQDSNVTAGHFANFGTGLRTLEMTAGSCVETVTYDRELLEDENGVHVAANGATVLFDPAGNPDYINNGCLAPVTPFIADAGTDVSGCAGATISLLGDAEGQQSVLWSATTGNFSDASNLTTTYTIPANATGTITLTLTATNICGASVSDTVTITVNNAIVPNFNTTLTLCSGSAAPVLSNTSPNGITGTWSPSVINNTTGGTYVFTPNANQCASPVTLTVSVTNTIVPDFDTSVTFCSGTTAPILSNTSPNGITGTWTPPVINNTTGGTYVFTPNANQCASPVTLTVLVINGVVPDFQTSLTLCSGSTAPVLNNTSPNGITGNWTPSAINNTTGGTYVFTPNVNQCASPVTLTVTISSGIIPDFGTSLSLCNGATAPILETTSPNGITGTWSPATISNTASAGYVFTPAAGQCAQSLTLSVTVTTFSFAISQECAGNTAILEVVPDSFDPETATYAWADSSGSNVGDDAILNVSDWANTHQPASFPQSFSLTVTTAEGCTSTQSKTVDGIFCNIPKGISPNGDGMNDSFDLSGMDIKQLSVFNRYGVKVFTVANYTNQWHGQTDNGHDLPDGTYYYLIEPNTGGAKTGWVYISSNSN